MVEDELRRDTEQANRTECSGQRVQAQDRVGSLTAEEARLRLAIQAANIGFWDWDFKTDTVFHSPEWKRQIGYEVHEVCHDLSEWQNRLHPEDRDRVQAIVDNFLKVPRSTYEVEFRLRHRDGTYRWIHSHGLLLRDSAGKPDRLVGIHIDITASRNREEALRKSEERMRRLVETTSIIPWEADAETWQFRYVGPGAVAALGYPMAEWMRPGFWLAHLHAKDRRRAADLRRENCRRQVDFQSEYRMISIDGRSIWFHDVVHVLSGRHQAEALQGFLIDIGARKQAEEEHARLAAIVQSSHDAIIGEDLNGLITSWNQSAERIYGYSSAEAIGKSVRMLIPGHGVRELADILRRVRRGQMVDHFETVRIRKDGRHIHVSLVVSPICDAHGNITGASAIVRDITERKQLEAEVLQISEREQQRIARDLHDSLGQLLSGTVHLARALHLGLAEEALPEAAAAGRIAELLNQAVAEARSLARGLYPVRPELNGLMAALDELATRTREVFKINCSVTCAKPVLIRDNAVATHLYRIAQEAVSNALKHGHAHMVEIMLTTSKAGTALLIVDDGRGFNQQHRSHNGMGIRIMRYRAAMLGGALSIRRNTGSGVRVTCSVPVRTADLWIQKSAIR
jgi:PAS domain S-box-containing protein